MANSLPGYVHNKALIAIAVMVALATIAAYQVLPSTQRWFAVLSVPVLLLGFHYRNRISNKWRAAFLGFISAVLVIFILRSVLIMSRNVTNPPELDFYSYWIYGRAIALGLNPYQAENLRQLAIPLNLSPEFMGELYLFQTPPSLFLFLPLGWFDIHTSYAMWYVIQAGSLILSVGLLWRTFQSKEGLWGLLLVSTLVLMLNSTLSTISFGQVNFLAMLMLILFWRNRQSLVGGMWLALGILIKPVLVFVLIYPAIQRHWRTLAGVGVALVVASMLTILAFGPALFFDYFSSNPIVEKMPGYFYVENINQSLLATVLRLTAFDVSNGVPFTQPIFVSLALLLTLVTAWLVFRPSLRNGDWTLALIIAFALLVYPKTLSHYSVFLIMSFLLIWMNRLQLVGGVWSSTAFITLEYLLIHNGNYAFVAVMVNWLVLAAVCIWIVYKRPNLALRPSTAKQEKQMVSTISL